MAVGAAIQGGVLSGDVKDVLLLDVVHSVDRYPRPWVEYDDETHRRQHNYPTRKSETFSTAADNQPEVTIRVLQGGTPMAADDKLLGEFSLGGIAPHRAACLRSR